MSNGSATTNVTAWEISWISQSALISCSNPGAIGVDYDLLSNETRLATESCCEHFPNDFEECLFLVALANDGLCLLEITSTFNGTGYTPPNFTHKRPYPTSNERVKIYVSNGLQQPNYPLDVGTVLFIFPEGRDIDGTNGTQICAVSLVFGRIMVYPGEFD